MSTALEVALALCTGVALSAVSGLRAFVPPLVAGILARAGHYHLHASFDWLASTPALVALAVACVVEVLADKVPAIDHALDVAATPLRTVAGFLVTASAVAPLPTWAVMLLGVIGGGTALSVHALKSTARGASTITTGGLANPLISIAEDVVCAVVSIVSVLLAALAAFIAVVALVAIVVVGVRLWRRRRALPNAVPAPASPGGAVP